MLSGVRVQIGRRHRLAIAAVVLLAGCGVSAPPSPAPAASCAPPVRDLPGLAVTGAPWPAELEHLKARLEAMGSPVLTREGQVIDRHFHVRVFAGRQPVKVPESIGLAGTEMPGGIMTSGFVTEIHTHDASGWVHIHAVADRPFLLGEFFDIWGVAFSAERLGGYCTGDGATIGVFVIGREATGDPRDVDLVDLTAIVVTFGTEAELPDPIPGQPPG
jgi:hypothetical protein